MSQIAGSEIRSETVKLKRELTLLPLFALIYFTVCGGSFGVEPLIGLSGPGVALILLVITPIFFSIPNMLMVRELNSMMPVEGGYYHWVKQAFGPFTGFMAGWMNWVVSWVDVTIYPVLFARYISYFIPALRDGLTVQSFFLPSWLLQWFVALLLIWAISALNVRGARLAGLTANWLGVIMLIPLALMSLVGLYNILVHGVSTNLPLLPAGEALTSESFFGSLSIGLFVVMWNYMGWELPTAAGDEIVNPRRTYPLAMTLVLIAAIATYTIPVLTGLYGGAGDDGKYILWGQEELEEGAGIAPVMSEYGINEAQLSTWGVDPAGAEGWQFPSIAQAVGEKAAGKGSLLAGFLGVSVSFAAMLSMIGLFIGNGLGGTRVPFALAEDGMMPKFLVKVHPRYGTPWVSILFCGLIYSIFAIQAFEFLVVVDVFLNMVVLLAQFFALWRLRVTHPDVPRDRVPGGTLGLTLVTIFPTAIILLAIYSQIVEEGLSSLWLALAAMAIGAVLYFPIRARIKKDIPDIDPFRLEAETD